MPDRTDADRQLIGAIVLDLRESDRSVTYCLEPVPAVIAAYAQMERGDFNAWDYGRKYRTLVVEGNLTVACGDWCAFKDGR